MKTQRLSVRFFLYVSLICLVVCRADFLYSATADESEPIVIEAREVQNSVESYLEAIAINGQEITPTAFPEVNLGDVVTVRVRVQNAYPGTIKALQCGATWGTGLVYRGQLTGQNVLCRFDDEIQKVIIDIDAIPGDPDQSAVVGKRLADSARWYSFDLKVAGCENLAIHVYTDELYSCQFEKTYHLAARITTPEIRYTVSLNPRQVLGGEKQQAAIAINNAGDGRASGFVMETNLEKFSALVSRVSPGFAYDPGSGNFIGGDIAPGQSLALRFDLVAGKGGGSPPEAAILFHPVYADDCGFRLQAPEKFVMLQAKDQESRPDAWGADLGLAVALALPEVVEDCQAQEAVVTITKTRPADYYDLDIVLDTGNYDYLGDLTTTGFDGLAPLAHTGRPGVVVLSFDKDLYRTEPLSRGGTLRFKLRKKCRMPAEMKASIRFVDHLGALTAERETPPGQPLNLLKREINTFFNPMARQTADLALRVTPECRRMEAGELLPWTVYVTNRGNGTAFDVRLEDVLAENVIFQQDAEAAAIAPQIDQDKPTPGKTALTWNLGDIPSSQTRKVAVAARTLADKESSEYPVNTSLVRVASGCAGDACQDKEMAAPCFLLPDDCVSDVYEKPEKLHGFLSLAYIYQSNLYEAYKNPKGVWATHISPGLWVALPASHERLVDIATTSATPGGLAVSPFFPKNNRRYQAYLLYSPQWEIYHNENKNNMLTHRADGYFHYNSQNRFSLQLIDQYKRAHDSISSRRYGVEDKYRTNLFSAVSTLGLTEKIELRLDYSNFLVNYDGSENAINDRVDNSWALYGYFRLTDKTRVFAEYEYGDINYRRHYLDSAEDRYFAGIRWEITEKTSGQIKGGYGFRDYDDDGLSDIDTWMAEVVIDYDLTEKTRIVVNAYRRYEESMGQGLHWDNNSLEYSSTNMLTHMIGVSLNYDLTSKLHLNLHGTLFFDEYAYEYDDDLWEDKKQRDREYAVSPTIKFDFLKWLTFDLAYTYTHVDSNYSEGEFDDHTVIARGTIYR